MDWFRAWLEIEEPDKAITVPVYGIRKSIRLDREACTLAIEFPRKKPEIDAVLQGFKYEPGARFIGNFEWKVTGSSGALKPVGSGFSLSGEDLLTCDLSAYFVVDEEAESPVAVTLTIVPELTGGGKQISLEPNGIIHVSPDLIGRTVKLRVIYPDAIAISTQKVETLTAHLVGVEGEKVYWIGLYGCTIAQAGNPLRLAVSWETAKSECLTP